MQDKVKGKKNRLNKKENKKNACIEIYDAESAFKHKGEKLNTL